MAFWSEANLDPKRKFRWVVQIAGLGIGEYIAKTVDKPKFEVSEEEHKFINHTFYYPGRVTWQEVSLTLFSEPDMIIQAMLKLRKPLLLKEQQQQL